MLIFNVDDVLQDTVQRVVNDEGRVEILIQFEIESLENGMDSVVQRVVELFLSHLCHQSKVGKSGWIEASRSNMTQSHPILAAQVMM